MSISLSAINCQVRREKNHGMDVSPCGAVAVFADYCCTVFIDTGNSLEPLRGFKAYGSPISAIGWCRGSDPDGHTPLHLALFNESGGGIVIETTNFTEIAHAMFNDSYVTAVMWDSISATNFYIGTSTGTLAYCKIESETIVVVWSMNLNFRIDYIRISPFDYRNLFVAGGDGNFSLVSIAGNGFQVSSTEPAMKIGEKIVDCYFHPFLNNVVVMVLPSQMALYFTESKLTLPFQSDGNHEPLSGAYFTDPQNENAFLVVYATHARYIRAAQKDSKTMQSQHIRFIGSLKSHSEQIAGVAFANKRLYVWNFDNVLAVYELRGHQFWATRVSRGVCYVPKQFAVMETTLVFGCGNGVIQTTGKSEEINTCSIKKHLKVCASAIDQLVAVDTDTCVVTSFENKKQRVMFVNMKTNEITPLLKTSLEVVASSPVKIATSLSREFVAIIVENSTLLFYHIVDNSPHLLKTMFLTMQGNVHCTFTENSREFWMIDRTQRVEVLAIDPTSETPISIKDNSHVLKVGVPTAVTCARNSLIIGTEKGTVSLYSWIEEVCQTKELSTKPIESLELSLDHRYVAARTVNGKTFILDLETMDVKKVDHRTSSVVFTGANTAITQTGDILCARQGPELKQYRPDVASLFKGHITMQSPENKKKQFLELVKTPITPTEFAKAARQCHFPLLADLVSNLDSSQLVSASMCANMHRDCVLAHLRNIGTYLENQRESKMRKHLIRNLLLRGDHEGAFGILLSCPPDSPNFVLDVLKASLIEKGSSGESMAPTVAALVSAGKQEDAVDILLMTKVYREAARILASEGDVETAVHIIKTVLSEENCEPIFSVIEQTLLNARRTWNVVAMHMARQRFADAAEIARSQGKRFVSDVISAMTFEDGKISANIHNI